MENKTVNLSTHPKKRKSRMKDVWIRLRRSRLAMLGLAILVLLILVAIFADFIAPYDYAEQDLMNSLQKPSSAHLMGTDEFGRDIFSRLVYGSRISLIVGFIAVGISVILGGSLGAIAGYFGGRVDQIIMRFMDILLAIPAILLSIAVLAALGPGLFNLMIATGISAMPGYARIVRASVLSVKEQEFVEAARAVGAGNAQIIVKHIIPNSLAPLIVQATLGISSAILTAASLSFLGLGITPPTPEWGAMLSGGRSFIRDYSYITFFPGLAIAITIFALNVLGDGLRDALDPKLKN